MTKYPHPYPRLERWRMFRTTKGGAVTVYAVGYSEWDDCGIVTPAVTKWNAKTRVLTTKTGDQFELMGDPGTSKDADEAWRKWCTRQRLQHEHVSDISQRYALKRPTMADRTRR